MHFTARGHGQKHSSFKYLGSDRLNYSCLICPKYVLILMICYLGHQWKLGYKGTERTKLHIDGESNLSRLPGPTLGTLKSEREAGRMGLMSEDSTCHCFL